MKKTIRKLFQLLTRGGVIAKFMARNMKLNESTAEIFIKNNPEIFKQQLYQYPSAINNGYRHIERVIDLANYFKLNSKSTIIDIGAAEGVISQMFSEAFPLATIYAFEPINITFNTLKKNTAANKKIIAINKAIGNSIEERTIHVAERITSSSIFEIQKNIKNSYFASNLNHKQDENIRIVMLDDEIADIPEINIIKIDVQGFELEALKGATLTLQKTNIVLLEMQNHELYNRAPKYYELDEYLRKNNFELFDMIPSIRQDEMLYEWDGIYVNKKLLS